MYVSMCGHLRCPVRLRRARHGLHDAFGFHERPRNNVCFCLNAPSALEQLFGKQKWARGMGALAQLAWGIGARPGSNRRTGVHQGGEQRPQACTRIDFVCLQMIVAAHADKRLWVDTTNDLA